MPTSTLPDSAPPVPAPATLLLVDDEPAVLSALRRLFRTEGYRIVQASGGAEGLELLAAHAPDVVISDMRMPGMDGAQFLEQVRARDPHPVRLLLTGYADIGSTIQAINRGEIHRYVEKPWDDRELLLLVRDALARRQLERRNAELTALTEQQNEALRVANQTLEARVAARTAEIGQINDMLETAYQELRDQFLLSVNMFVALLESREEGMAGHARRVARLARGTAALLGLDERQQQDVEMAALLHDVGKVGFPDRMLRRPTASYNDEERARYRQHAVDGEAALMPLVKMQPVARMVRQHHERWDGRGFPDGIAGPDITLGARIIAAASDWDGLVHGGLSDRPVPPELARRHLRDGAGSRYDPAVVDALVRAIDEEAARPDDHRLIDVRDLRPGMVLARDLLSSRGVILLAAGYVFDAQVIRQVNDFARRENLKLSLHVRAEPAATVPPTP